MSDGDESIFAQGYDRRQWSVLEPAFNANRIDPREISVKAKPTAPPPKQEPVATIQTREPVRDHPEAAPITAVFDPRNQLASLIKNAKQNEQAIKARNERMRHSKLQSKNRYGW